MTADDMRDWRKRLGLDLKDAAEALGCSRNSIPRWEAGKTEIPRYVALACAAIALGVPPYGKRDIPR
jgi:transcriptional regulator with XRE-family HTH domain